MLPSLLLLLLLPASLLGLSLKGGISSKEMPWENVETRNKIWLLRKSAAAAVGKKPIIRMYGGSASSFKRGIVTDVTFVAL